MGLASTKTEQFLAHKWRALAANRMGVMGDARSHFDRMIATWRAAKAPSKKEGRRPVALLLGGVEIAAVLPPDGPATIQAVLTATPTLAADFPHDKRRIQRLLKPASPTKGKR